jgi:hydrogenase expression/formation protein HypE
MEEMSREVTLGHGSGGKLTGELIRKIFASRFVIEEPLTDSAVIHFTGSRLAFTTDSYVVDPIFFPGGDIGRLAVCGTVNDLAVSGSYPMFLSASFIIEEGFPVSDLEKIAESMAEEASRAGVRIVTGDTKVVERGKCDKIFITTSGTGILDPSLSHIGTGIKVGWGDKIIINGTVGNHSLAVLGAREKLGFRTPVMSDCASLNRLIRKVTDECREIHFMRDLTRGGLASVLNELAEITGKGILINESSVPVDEPVRGLCEILGFDPFYLANEGKLIIVAGEKECGKVIEVMKSDSLGEQSAVIGEITPGDGRSVLVNTLTGGRRIMDMPSGLQLPRIC